MPRMTSGSRFGEAMRVVDAEESSDQTSPTNVGKYLPQVASSMAAWRPRPAQQAEASRTHDTKSASYFSA